MNTKDIQEQFLHYKLNNFTVASTMNIRELTDVDCLKLCVVLLCKEQERLKEELSLYEAEDYNRQQIS